MVSFPLGQAGLELAVFYLLNAGITLSTLVHFLEDTSRSGLGLNLIILLSLQRLLPNEVKFYNTGVSISTYEIHGDTVQPMNSHLTFAPWPGYREWNC